jgi:hypothetical protein
MHWALILKPTWPFHIVQHTLMLCLPPLSVQWDAFSMPELKNFVRMLQREEEEHVKQILQRYALARTRMQEALAAASIPGGSSASGSTPG